MKHARAHTFCVIEPAKADDRLREADDNFFREKKNCETHAPMYTLTECVKYGPRLFYPYLISLSLFFAQSFTTNSVT